MATAAAAQREVAGACPKELEKEWEAESQAQDREQPTPREGAKE